MLNQSSFCFTHCIQVYKEWIQDLWTGEWPRRELLTFYLTGALDGGSQMSHVDFKKI